METHKTVSTDFPPLQTIDDVPEILQLIGTTHILYVDESNDVYLLQDRRFPSEGRPDLKVTAELFEILGRMRWYRELPEVKSNTSSGWRTMGFSQPGRYIKFMM